MTDASQFTERLVRLLPFETVLQDLLTAVPFLCFAVAAGPGLVSTAYRALCAELKSKLKALERPGAAAMRASWERLEAWTLVCPCPDSSPSRPAAQALMEEVDAASRGVKQAQVRLLHMDVRASSPSVRFGALKEPLVAAALLELKGRAVMARQAAAPPEQTHVVVPLCPRLGCSARVAVSRKRCRPPWKFFTKLEAAVTTATFPSACLLPDCHRQPWLLLLILFLPLL